MKSDTAFKELFLKGELDALRHLHHSSMIGVYELLEDRKHFYIVMELVENGYELKDMIYDRMLKEI